LPRSRLPGCPSTTHTFVRQDAYLARTAYVSAVRLERLPLGQFHAVFVPCLQVVGLISVIEDQHPAAVWLTALQGVYYRGGPVPESSASR
jgi:hypothetical protein